MKRQRELIEHEGGADAEADREQLPPQATRLKREIEHPRQEDDHDPYDHVVKVRVADPAASPTAPPPESSIATREHKREQRRGKEKQQRLAAGQAKPVHLDGIDRRNQCGDLRTSLHRTAR
jgi:hypothetical protein